LRHESDAKVGSVAWQFRGQRQRAAKTFFGPPCIAAIQSRQALVLKGEQAIRLCDKPLVDHLTSLRHFSTPQ
jgi:hypothetical protein